MGSGFLFCFFFFFLLKGLKRLNKGSVKKKKGTFGASGKTDVHSLFFMVSFMGFS